MWQLLASISAIFPFCFGRELGSARRGLRTEVSFGQCIPVQFGQIDLFSKQAEARASRSCLVSFHTSLSHTRYGIEWSDDLGYCVGIPSRPALDPPMTARFPIEFSRQTIESDSYDGIHPAVT